MKNALRYQASDYDCGPTSLENALRFLFEREELTPSLLKAISAYTLDLPDAGGTVGPRGTSQRAMEFVAAWLDDYAQTTKFPLKAQFVGGDLVAGGPSGVVGRWLADGGAVVLRLWLGSEGHYVVATALTETGIGVFDPYADPDFSGLPGVVASSTEATNRLVSWDRLERLENQSYSLGQFDKRAAILLTKTGGKR